MQRSIRKLLRRWRWRTYLWRAALDLCVAVTLWATVALIINLVWPDWVVTVATWTGAILVGVLSLRWIVLRPPSVAELDRRLQLRDRLITYAELRHPDDPEVAWLAEDLSGCLAVLPEATVADRFWSRRRKALGVLVPFCLLALFLGPLVDWLSVGLRKGGPGDTGQGEQQEQQQARTSRPKRQPGKKGGGGQGGQQDTAQSRPGGGGKGGGKQPSPDKKNQQQKTQPQKAPRKKQPGGGPKQPNSKQPDRNKNGGKKPPGKKPDKQPKKPPTKQPQQSDNDNKQKGNAGGGGNKAGRTGSGAVLSQNAINMQLHTFKQFLLPSTIQDGPSAKREAWVSMLREREEETDDAASPQAGRRRPKRRQAEQLPDKKRLFKRAAERALASRRIAPAERPFVRRYFQELEAALEQGK